GGHQQPALKNAKKRAARGGSLLAFWRGSLDLAARDLLLVDVIGLRQLAGLPDQEVLLVLQVLDDILVLRIKAQAIDLMLDIVDPLGVVGLLIDLVEDRV